jgi:hypothetical protein
LRHDNDRKAARFAARPLVHALLQAQDKLKPGEFQMSGQVVLDFEDQADALRFALAAGSVMAGDAEQATLDLVQETARISRIRLDAPNGGKKKTGSPERAA